MSALPEVRTGVAPDFLPACGRCGVPYEPYGPFHEREKGHHAPGAPIVYFYKARPLCECWRRAVTEGGPE